MGDCNDVKRVHGRILVALSSYRLDEAEYAAVGRAQVVVNADDVGGRRARAALSVFTLVGFGRCVVQHHVSRLPSPGGVIRDNTEAVIQRPRSLYHLDYGLFEPFVEKEPLLTFFLHAGLMI